MNNSIFIGKKNIWFAFSSILIILGIVSMVRNTSLTGAPFNLGIDFTGGTNLILKVDAAEKVFLEKGEISAQVRQTVRQQITEVLVSDNIQHIQVTVADKRYFSVKSSVLNKETLDKVVSDLKDKLGGVTVLQSDFIGPTIGKDLQKQSVLITVVAIFLLLIYITFRFEFWAALAAILALVHDTLITLGLSSLLHLEVDSAFVAAILTILGYSINDTIVIFDRIRENTRTLKDSFADIAEISIRQTLTRSIFTVVTVLIVLAAIFFFGGSSLHDFTSVLLIGIFFGCYSSIFIASPLLVMFKKLND